MIKVGVTGGIGSGKSSVCRLFVRRGVPIYDSDAEARRLMHSAPLRERLIGRFGTAVFKDGALDRAYLASVVFNDAQALADLDAIVHPAVRRDFAAWADRQSGDYVIIESALLFEAGLDEDVDRVVVVIAPQRLRVERICRRDGLTEEQVLKRMATQIDDNTLRSRADYTIFNIVEDDLDTAVSELDILFRYEAHAKP